MISQLVLAATLVNSGAITHRLEIGPDGQIQCVSAALSHEEVAALRLPDGPKSVPVIVRRGPIEIHYLNFPGEPEFPEEAKEAVQYGVDRWLELIAPRGPIQIEVRFRPRPESTTDLGGVAVYTSCSRYRLRACGASSLVNHVHERDLDPEKPDMSIDIYDLQGFHDSGGWYLRTDGQAPPSTLDLATVAMHEIAHGLGIVAGMRQPAERVLERHQWQQGSLDSLYDSYLWTESHGRVIDLPTPSGELYEAMTVTSGNLLWGSHLWKNQHGERMLSPEVNGAPVPLMSPRTYDVAVTASHLDAFSYPKNSGNSLLTLVYPGWSQHCPGPVLLSMLYDMGWDLTESGWDAVWDRRMTRRRTVPPGRPQRERPERRR